MPSAGVPPLLPPPLPAPGQMGADDSSQLCRRLDEPPGKPPANKRTDWDTAFASMAFGAEKGEFPWNILCSSSKRRSLPKLPLAISASENVVSSSFSASASTNIGPPMWRPATSSSRLCSTSLSTSRNPMGVESPWSKTAASAVGVAASRWPVGGGGSGTPDSPDRSAALMLRRLNASPGRAPFSLGRFTSAAGSVCVSSVPVPEPNGPTAFPLNGVPESRSS
mmetsp:Transcript_8479/g.25662  ORF Transcript_8479/g.25662 Transcript_8479/m.25662 type:complete len:223 (+) Transcript_8479:1662-2330(+)